MRTSGHNFERRELLIAALLAEHFTFVDVRRVLVWIFPGAHLDNNRETDTQNDRSGFSPSFHTAHVDLAAP